MRQMWIIIQLADFQIRKAVCETTAAIIHGMSGEIVKLGGVGDLVVLAKFPHRRYRSVERAIAVALSTLPVKRTIVVGQDPFVLRDKTLALTMDLFRRQDEVVGV